MSSPEKEKVKEICIGENGRNNHRNWCSDLPMDALLLIMSKVGAIYILKDAQWVCKNWGKVCREVPSLWRNIDIDMTSLHCNNYNVVLHRMACEAIDRAQGEVQQFEICYFGDDELLKYLADSTSLLRRLRLISAYDISEEGLAESVGRFPLLEEIDITFGSYGEQVFELVGTACPHLKCFRYNQVAFREYDSDKERNAEALGIANYMPNPRQLQIVGNKLSSISYVTYTRYFSDDEALCIAKYMPNLCQLQIIGNSLTNIGLMAILDRCVHLESLDLRCCFKINMDSTLRAKCARIKDLRLPDDPTDDYEFRAETVRDDNPGGYDDDYDQHDMIPDDFDPYGSDSYRSD